MSTLRKIDFNVDKNFECDGKKFEVTDTLSFTRYKELQKISLEFGYSMTFENITDNLKKNVEYFNQHDYFNMSINTYKMLEGIKSISEKEDPALRLCALFINEIGEDPTKYSEAMMKAKIDSWGRELEVLPFVSLAASLVPGWMPLYQIAIRNTLEKEKEEKTNEKNEQS